MGAEIGAMIENLFITCLLLGVSSDAGFAVTRNNLYKTIPTLHKQWSLTVDIMPTGLVSGWANIMRVGLGEDISRYGDRTPAIWFNSMTTELVIASAVNGNKNYHSVVTPAIPMDTWTRVEITQLRQFDGSYQYTIIIAGEIFDQLTNNNPEEFSNVEVYTSDNFYNAAKAMITNLIIWTSPDEDIPEVIWGVNSLDNIYRRDGIEGNWDPINGALKQVTTGPMGVFGINTGGQVFYRRGTHKNQFSTGTDWQLLAGVLPLTYISSGLTDVLCITESDKIFWLENIELKGNDISFTWTHVSGGLKQISASGVNKAIWGVNSNDEIFYKANLLAPWQNVAGLLKQVEVGAMGVFGVNANDEIFYRLGTNENSADIGTGWQQLPGLLRQISVGTNNFWGVNAGDEIYTMENIKFVSSQIEFSWKKMEGGLKQIASISSPPPISPQPDWLIFPTEFGIIFNNLHQTIPTLHKQWAISFDILPMGIINEWVNILQVGLEGNLLTYGERTPAIYFLPGTTTLLVSSAINGMSNFDNNVGDIPLHQWTRVKVSQIRLDDSSYEFSIQIENTVKARITNTDPREFTDVKMYTSSPHFSAAEARIGNLKFQTFPDVTSSCSSTDEMRYWYNANFQGNDIHSTIQPTVENCMDQCIATVACNAFTYDTLNRFETNCWLKSKSESINDMNYQMDYNEMISGMRCSFQPIEDPSSPSIGKYHSERPTPDKMEIDFTCGEDLELVSVREEDCTYKFTATYKCNCT